MSRRRVIGAMAALILCAWTGVLAQDSRANHGKILVPATRPTIASPVIKGAQQAPAKSAYLIGPQDVLDISVWKEPDVSRVVTVRPDGRISLPLIHDTQASGFSAEQLALVLAERFHKFLNDPKVTVIVSAMNSQRVFVVGEVLRAGAFPLLPGMTVLQALSSAGGFTTFANAKKIHVMRERDGKAIQLEFNYREVLRGERPEQNITLEPGDTVVVP